MHLPGMQWSSGEASSLNDFLNSPLGAKWLKILELRKPRIDMLNADRAALSGSFAAGYEHALDQIFATRGTLPPETPGLRPIDPTRD